MNKLFDYALGLLSPHICKGCGNLGAPLCSRCIIDISRALHPICASCHRPIRSDNLCELCRRRLRVFDALYTIGPRDGVLKSLVGDYKYNSEYAAADCIASLLNNRLRTAGVCLSTKCAIVPIPTIAKHIRQRGFDHMLTVAKRLSTLVSCPVNNKLLVRTNNVSQHNLNARDRRQLIGRSLALRPGRDIPDTVLLLDDIWTTGATMTTAADLLRRAGVKRIIGITVCVQMPHNPNHPVN